MKLIEGLELLIFVLLVLCVRGGVSKGSVGGRGSVGGGRSSGGRSYTGGGGGYYSGSSSSGSGSVGSVWAIYLGAVGGCALLSLLICGCCMFYRRAKGVDRTPGVIIRAPNETRTSPNIYQNQNVEVVTDLPPAYSEIDKPIFDVQNEIKRTQLNDVVSNQHRL